MVGNGPPPPFPPRLHSNGGCFTALLIVAAIGLGIGIFIAAVELPVMLLSKVFG